MRPSREEHAVKLELISSIAKSQLALARILDSIASVSDLTPMMARRIGENIRLLTSLQEGMAESVSLLALGQSRTRLGQPTNPWINPRLQTANSQSDMKERR